MQRSRRISSVHGMPRSKMSDLTSPQKVQRLQVLDGERGIEHDLPPRRATAGSRARCPRSRAGRRTRRSRCARGTPRAGSRRSRSRRCSPRAGRSGARTSASGSCTARGSPPTRVRRRTSRSARRAPGRASNDDATACERARMDADVGVEEEQHVAAWRAGRRGCVRAPGRAGRRSRARSRRAGARRPAVSSVEPSSTTMHSSGATGRSREVREARVEKARRVVRRDDDRNRCPHAPSSPAMAGGRAKPLGHGVCKWRRDAAARAPVARFAGGLPGRYLGCPCDALSSSRPSACRPA